MKSLICPISSIRINSYVVRTTGLFVVIMIALYALTGSIVFMAALTVDYVIRAFTPLRSSPLSWLAAQVVHRTALPVRSIDKAPKIFAARVGFLFALTSTVVFLLAPTLSLIIAVTLMGFAVLESVFNVCVGCLVYTYIVFPLYHRPPSR